MALFVPLARRLVVLAALLTALGWPWPGPCQAAGERILNFESLVTVRPDSNMEVTETITVRATGDKIRRGIVREFPTTYTNRQGQKIRVGFDILRITRDGRPSPYHTATEGNGVKIYIGDKDTLIPPGQYTYAITYRTDRQLGFFPDYDELYWNVTGNGWEFVIERASVLIELPPGAKVLQSAAYTGRQGQQGHDFAMRQPQGGAIAFDTTRSLAPGEGLTVAVAWPKGLVAKPSALAMQLRDQAAAVVGGGAVLALLLYYLWAWFKVGRDPASGPIIPLFAPPAGMSPAAVRYLLHMSLDQKALAANLVDMAVKGFLKIKEDGDDFSLTRAAGKAANLTPDEQKAGDKLFAAARTEVKLEQKQHRLFQDVFAALKQGLDAQQYSKLFSTNAGYFGSGILLTLAGLGAIILASPDRGQAGGMTLWLSMWSAGCLVLGWFTLSRWRAVGHGGKGSFGRVGGAMGMTIFAAVFWGAWFLGLYAFQDEMGAMVVIAIVALIAVNPLFFYLLKAPSLMGRKLTDQIEGFKLYLSVAEEDRLNKLNPPEKTPELFEKFLPYAMALDVEQQWGERFKEVLDKAGRDDPDYTPMWYHGTHWGSRSFAEDLGGSFSSAISSASSAPGSSSGSGGGGSSGGGGGGGGGGGW